MAKQKKKPIRINLFMEVGVVFIAIAVCYYMEWGWIIPVIIYALLWVGWLILAGAVGVWRAYLKNKYKNWIKPPK